MAAGLVVGAGRLGWRGVVGTVAGALSSGLLLPYLVIAPVFGIQAPEVDVYGQYSAVAVAAVVGSAIATVLATRSAFRIEIRSLLPVAVGLIVLAIWLAAWVVWAIALSPRLM